MIYRYTSILMYVCMLKINGDMNMDGCYDTYGCYHEMVIGLDWNITMDDIYERGSLGRRNESFHSIARRDNEYVRYFFTVDLLTIHHGNMHMLHTIHVTMVMKKF